MSETQWMTLLETAEIMKRLPDQVTRMCEDGKLEYYLEDGRYFVSRESIDLFMYTRTDDQVPEHQDSNGTPRRQYGRAPDSTVPSTESAAETATIQSRDGTDADGVETPDYSEESEPETGSAPDSPKGYGEEWLASPEDDEAEATQEGPVNREDGEEGPVNREDGEEGPVNREDGEEGPVNREDGEEGPVNREDGEEGPANREDGEDEEDREEAVSRDDKEDEEDREAALAPVDEELTSSRTEPVHPGVNAVKILADLRAALARHAREHRAFCDEIVDLADALESTLSRDDDKTSELTREISSLLARYTRR